MMIYCMTDDDIACLREFMDAGNGRAIFAYYEADGYPCGNVDEAISLLKKSAEAGFHLAADELADLFGKGGSTNWCSDDEKYLVHKDEEQANKFGPLAEKLRERWEQSNAGRILVSDFYGWVQLRCGEKIFYASYLFPSFPMSILQMCIDRIEKGKLLSEWFSDENHGHDIIEEMVNGRPRLFIRWKDDEQKEHSDAFPNYDFRAFAEEIAKDIEADIFGFADFMTSCDGRGLREAVQQLKSGLSRLRVLLESPRQLNNGNAGHYS